MVSRDYLLKCLMSVAQPPSLKQHANKVLYRVQKQPVSAIAAANETESANSDISYPSTLMASIEFAAFWFTNKQLSCP